MIIAKKAINSVIASVISAFALTGCGSTVTEQVPVVYYDAMYANQQYQQQPQQQNSCCCQCNNQQANSNNAQTTTNNQTSTTPTTPVVVNPPTTITPVKTPTTAVTEVVKPTTPTVVAATPKPAAPVSTASKGRQVLDKAMLIISSANAIETQIDKYERNLKDGSSIQQSLTFWSKKPGTVKLEVTAHSTKASSVGAKVSYKSGTGKATVRPGGALSFITKEMDQTDSNITSPNEYTPEQVDFFSMVKRLSGQEYKADITGKTTVNGAEVYLLKITTSSTNTFDSRITHEVIGFDPKTFEVKVWEAYTADSEEAYFRITIKSFKALSDLPDSTFKV
jgi:hypothetical protein